MGKFGLSWSWKRAVGISALKGKVSRSIGVPLTRSGRQRKLGRMVEQFGLGLLLADGAESAAEPSVNASRVVRKPLQPHYTESWLRCATRRVVGLAVLLVSGSLATVGGSWLLDGAPWYSWSVLCFAVPGGLGLLWALRLMRGRAQCKAPMATADQLALIEELHGKLPRQITQEEGDQVIEFLRSHRFDCPFCGAKCKATNVMCGACRKRLEAVRVPIYLPK